MITEEITARLSQPSIYSTFAEAINLIIFAGGLGSYTPSKIQMTETPFQLGVSQQKQQQNGQKKNSEKEVQEEEVLRPSRGRDLVERFVLDLRPSFLISGKTRGGDLKKPEKL